MIKTEQIIQHKITKVNGEVGYIKYSIGKILGKGGFAKCFQGTNIETHKKYAVKVVEKATLNKNRAKQKLFSQIKIHKALHHKNIVEFDSVFEDHNNVYIILELCPNKTLGEMVKFRKKLTLGQVRYYMLQLIGGLEFMHSNRVIHRDLKMGNIFLSENMQMKIGDFGLAAKLQFVEEKKRTMCGTPNYIAPQIVQGLVGHSYQVDIWSTGVICYAMLFGRPPFQTTEVKSTYKKIKTCDYTFPAYALDEAKDFIKKILVLDPKKRLTISEMLKHPFLLNQDIPYELTSEALTDIPNYLKRGGSSLKSSSQFKNRVLQQIQPKLISNKEPKKNIVYDVLSSPRSIFNEEVGFEKFHPQDIKEDHKLNILIFVDYSTKYGLGYLMNNKYYGVYYNDSSVMSVNQTKTNVYYLDKPSVKQQKIQIYSIENLPKQRDFQKKFILLQRFIGHLKDQMAKVSKQKNQKGFPIQYESDTTFIFMKQWLKTKHAIMFRLSNKLFQVDFFDGSQILLNTDKKTVRFTGKNGNKIYNTLMGAIKATDNQLSRRIKYTKQILNSIRKGKQNEKGDKLHNENAY